MLKAARATFLILTGAVVMAAAVASPAAAQSVSIDLAGEDGSYTARILQLFLLVTVLSIAPGILVMATSFIRLIVVFSLLRSALGLQQSPPNSVLISLALFLTAFIMSPTLEASWREGVSPMLAEDIDQVEGAVRAARPFREFMAAQVEEDDLVFFQSLAARHAGPTPLREAAAPPLRAGGASGGVLGGGQAGAGTVLDNPEADLPPLNILLPAFIISELARAFEIGFLIMMPFLVIDLAIAAILMSMGMMMLPPQIVSLPIKLIFFVLIDGWRLLSESLVMSFY